MVGVSRSECLGNLFRRRGYFGRVAALSSSVCADGRRVYNDDRRLGVGRRKPTGTGDLLVGEESMEHLVGCLKKRPVSSGNPDDAARMRSCSTSVNAFLTGLLTHLHWLMMRRVSR